MRLAEHYEELKEGRTFLRKLFLKETSHYLPINIKRLIEIAKIEFGIGPNHQIDQLDPIVILDQVEELKKTMIIVQGDDVIS